jgi:uncharacterized protein YbbC (DUF1343 family)/CubicO group peptidase (beta-lactamase class C family)
MRSFIAVLVCFLLLNTLFVAGRQRHSRIASGAGISSRHLALIDPLVAESISKHEMPGAVVLVSHNGQTVWRKAYGARALQPAREEMTADTVFDLASLTKVIATTTSIMILVERGQLRLADPVSKYIPELKGQGRERVTIELLLTHRAGFAPDFNLGERWSTYEEAMNHLYREPLRNKPGARFVYSDIGFITLGEVVHRVSGQSLDLFAAQNIFKPLGMKDTQFKPGSNLTPRIAPTEHLSAAANYLGGDGKSLVSDRWLRGEVHDPTAFRMGGVAGHAGLFSTADDLAIFCQMLLNGGIYKGVRILSPMGIAMMTRPRAVSGTGATRGLGWDISTSFSSNKGEVFPNGSFGHTGFTGTSVWIDPSSHTFVIFLSNRVHPDGKGDVGSVRGRIASVVASAVEDTSPVEAEEFSRRYAAEVILSELQEHTILTQEAVAFVPARFSSGVLTGIDVLAKDGFKSLQGKRVGLVTNHTGRDKSGKPTIDILKDAPGVKLQSLFSPEHGIRGALDEKVSDTKDEQTGLPVFSLYGERRRPSPEQLKDLDALVFDIQDVGARFYTYISTLGNVMESAAASHIPLYVLDRPNPIGALDVEGPVADADKLGFTAFHTIPVRHGMTIGELAQLFNKQRNIECDLRVVKMENYNRAMWFDSTNLIWVNPSPNMRSLSEATLYPGIGLLETTNVSVGRGTDTPFEIIGAPWIDAQKLSSALNERNIEGVKFVPVQFTPKSSVFKDQLCNGINIIVTDRLKFHPVTAGIEIAVALRRLFTAQWKVDDYSRLLVNADTLARIKQGESAETIIQSWSKGLDGFKKAREEVLLYP